MRITKDVKKRLNKQGSVRILKRKSLRSASLQLPSPNIPAETARIAWKQALTTPRRQPGSSSDPGSY